jgi:gamma-glutamyltranspeptidase
MFHQYVVLFHYLTGGNMTPRDLTNYSARWRDPVADTVAGYRYYTLPPPSYGGLLPLYLRILDGK